MSKLKELFSDTLIYGVSSVFARFINYLLVPLYTGIFNPAEYGIVGLVYAAIAFLNVLFTMGMESSYLRYAKEREQASSYFKTLQLFLLASSLLLVLVLWVLDPLITPALGVEHGSPIFLMMLGILFFDTLCIVPFAELRFIQKAWTFAALKTLNVGINLALNFYLILGLNYGIEAVFISNLIASGITAGLIFFITAKMYAGSWSTPFLKQALGFGLPFIPAGIGHVINEMLDRFFIKGMSQEQVTSIYGTGLSSDDLVGIYNACYKLAVFMLLLVQMYRMAWQPFFMRRSDEQDAPGLYAQAFTYFNGAAAILFLGVALFVEQIVRIQIPFLGVTLIGEEYWMGLHIVPFLLIAYWFQGWYVNFSAGIFIKKETKRLAQITLIGATKTILLNLLLIPFLGISGSAIATLSSYFFMAMLLYYYSNKAYKVPYNLLQGFGIVVVAVIFLMSKSFLTEQNFPELLVSIGLFLIGSMFIVLISIRKGSTSKV